MANNIVLGILETLAIFSCCYGVYAVYGLNSGAMSQVYCSMWFIMGFLSNFCGLLSIVLFYIEEDENMTKSHYALQYHYLFAWLTVIIGYPALVTQFWLSYYFSYIAHVHVGLSIIPMLAWLHRKNQTIVLTTQMVSGIALVSHAYICFLAWNIWGLIGAGIMVFNIIALSLPTRHNIWSFSSREAFIIGLGAASYVFCIAVGTMAENRIVLSKLTPW